MAKESKEALIAKIEKLKAERKYHKEECCECSKADNKSKCLYTLSEITDQIQKLAFKLSGLHRQ
jgi:hypothetical protein